MSTSDSDLVKECASLKERIAELEDALMKVGMLATGWKYGTEGDHLLRIEGICRSKVEVAA